MKKIFIFLLIFIAFSSMTGCAKEENRSEDDKMESNCTLIVNDKDITSGNYVYMEENYVMLPFTATMEALGAKIIWQSETTAKIIFDGKDYILNTVDCTFIEYGTDDNLITPPPGNTSNYQIVENEFVLDYVTMRGAFQLMNVSININIDYDNKVVSIK